MIQGRMFIRGAAPMNRCSTTLSQPLSEPVLLGHEGHEHLSDRVLQHDLLKALLFSRGDELDRGGAAAK